MGVFIILFTYIHFDYYYLNFILILSLLIFILGSTLSEIIMLYRFKQPIVAKRLTGEKLSNGDFNDITIQITNKYPFSVLIRLIDEAPIQFQLRKLSYSILMNPGETKNITYTLRPTRRGEYMFGNINVFAKTIMPLVQRKIIIPAETTLPVYPSFIQMRKYEIMAISNRLTMIGVKKMRRIGHNLEFDQIREYVIGDDYRTVNWKATARRSKLMANQYMDERAQPVYCMIDMGRVMKMPFNELTLLDYSINASLVISNVALIKHDKAGIITFSHKTDSFLQAERKASQMQKIMELLYRQKTGFLETSYELLFSTVIRRINQRSLLLLFTNFETVASMHRQLPYLRQLAKRHLLVVIFFRNTELVSFIQKPATHTEQVYLKTIAEKFDFEKRLIVKELEKHGIASILTAPENLTVNTLNKYLELKARGLI
ncbi:MAG: DUF58 domain-containing protein [Candidatus Competibacteraceae bacterium]|nr:DUF58 domain-containing protein [Candidatus Competibacteraceae bacterium]